LRGKNENVANAETGGANAVELHLSGLTGTTSHSDMQKIQIIGFFFENKLHWQFKVENNIYKWLFRLHFYLHTKTFMQNLLHVINKKKKNLSK
jgi:hypothetical protein